MKHIKFVQRFNKTVIKQQLVIILLRMQEYCKFKYRQIFILKKLLTSNYSSGILHKH